MAKIWRLLVRAWETIVRAFEADEAGSWVLRFFVGSGTGTAVLAMLTPFWPILWVVVCLGIVAILVLSLAAVPIISERLRQQHDLAVIYKKYGEPAISALLEHGLHAVHLAAQSAHGPWTTLACDAIQDGPIARLREARPDVNGPRLRDWHEMRVRYEQCANAVWRVVCLFKSADDSKRAAWLAADAEFKRHFQLQTMTMGQKTQRRVAKMVWVPTTRVVPIDADDTPHASGPPSQSPPVPPAPATPPSPPPSTDDRIDQQQQRE